MKTLRQWQKIWDTQYQKNSQEHEQTRKYKAAKKLLHEYVGTNKYSVYELPYFVIWLGRFFTGSWNKHHAVGIRGILLKHFSNERNLFPIPINDNYDHIPKDENSGETTYLRKEVTVGTYSATGFKNIKAESLRLLDTDVLADPVQTITRDNKSYLITNASRDEHRWGYDVEAITRRNQAYDLLNDIQILLANTPINESGDLANILSVIEENTGYSIPVKYALPSGGPDDLWKFKAYKTSTSNYYLKGDLYQPFTGVDNAVRGIFCFIGAPLIFLRNLLSLIFFSRSHDGSWKSFGEDLLDNAEKTIMEPAAYLFDGSFSLLHGILQIVTTPLLLFKIPLRFCFKNENETIEDRICTSKIIGSLRMERDQCADEGQKKQITSYLIAQIHRKYLKGVARGETTYKNNEDIFFKKAQYPQDTLDSKPVDIEAQQEAYINAFCFKN